MFLDLRDIYGPASQLLATFIFVWAIWRFLTRDKRNPVLRSVAIVVLGDIGRSPRMMYHAESFATHAYETFLVGYKGAKPIPSLLSLPHIRFLYLSEPPRALSKLPFIITAPIKIIHQILTILDALLFRISKPPEFIMIQNPPSIPTLALVWFVGKCRGSKIIIDWHNLGYSILALKLGQNHPFVKIAKQFEATFGQSAYAHLFVTQAMRDHLVKEWRLIGHKAVLHDRPPSHFHRATPSETHELFLRLLPMLSTHPSLKSFLPLSHPPVSTPFTHVTSSPASLTHNPATPPALNMPSLRPDRPALLVSSTSWTPDEDFGILLEALGRYEIRAREIDKAILSGSNETRLPRVLMIVTGKGPLKDKYMSEVERLQNPIVEGDGGWKFVRCVSLWLEAEDYPTLLGSADLGVCLHSSSSALDLPMKVVDMFGCGLPVCALDFACLHELVKNGENGLVFNDAEQLASQLVTLLSSYPEPSALTTLRSSLLTSSTSAVHANVEMPVIHGEEVPWGSWAENWNRVVRPLVLRDADGYHAEWTRS